MSGGGREDVRVPVPVQVRREDRFGRIPSASVVITCCGPKSALASSRRFSYQAILSSASKRPRARPGPRPRPGPPRRPKLGPVRRRGDHLLRTEVRARLGQPVLVPGDLVVLPKEAESTSGLRPRPGPPRRPSRAPSADVVIRLLRTEVRARLVQPVLVPGDLVIVMAIAESTSGSPSPSRSAAKTERHRPAAVVITCCGPKSALASSRRFSYQAILSSYRWRPRARPGRRPRPGPPRRPSVGAVRRRGDHLLRHRSPRSPRPAGSRTRRSCCHRRNSRKRPRVRPGRRPRPGPPRRLTERTLKAAVVIICSGPNGTGPHSRHFLGVREPVAVAVHRGYGGPCPGQQACASHTR